jgi:hypothetical protein
MKRRSIQAEEASMTTLVLLGLLIALVIALSSNDSAQPAVMVVTSPPASSSPARGALIFLTLLFALAWLGQMLLQSAGAK